MAGGASASDGTGVSKSVSVSARLFPSRLFGYIFLGNAKKVYFLELGYLSRALRRFFDPQSKAKSPRIAQHFVDHWGGEGYGCHFNCNEFS
jgi:hypothetical protein